MKRPSAKSLAKACAAWNGAHEVGASVRYWTGLREGDGKVGKTIIELLGGDECEAER